MKPYIICLMPNSLCSPPLLLDKASLPSAAQLMYIMLQNGTASTNNCLILYQMSFYQLISEPMNRKASAYKCDDGTFCRELCSTEECSDKAVDQFVFRVYTGVVVWYWLSLWGMNTHTHTR